MRRRTVRGVLALTGLWFVASAHIGSSLVVQDGMAGPYSIRVLVRPPGVIPGLVEVVVRSTAPVRPTSVTVRPALWRFGLKGAPPAEPTTPVPGEDGTFSTNVWIMESGSYAFHVFASGPAGEGSLVVPVSSAATTASTVPPWLGGILLVLSGFLVVGLIAIVGAASRESVLAPGRSAGGPDIRRARRAMTVAGCLIAVTLTGGWTWWNAVDRDYRRRLDKPLAVEGTVTAGAERALTLRVTDSSWSYVDPKQSRRRVQIGTPVMPDHGKLMHLFLIEAGARGAITHVHPRRSDVSTFTTPLTGIPAGTYWLFADVVRESGHSVSMADTVVVPAGTSAPNGDGDDAWALAPASADRGSATLSDGATMSIRVEGLPVVARDVTIHARVTNADGTPAILVPWLGMSGHAIVVRTDGRVFMHVHPMGTASMAAQERLLRREAGDTVNHGEAQPVSSSTMDAASPAMSMRMAAPSATGDVSFPVAFPSAGTYRVFVQVRRTSGGIETGALTVTVP